jgi:hypothetical protein
MLLLLLLVKIIKRKSILIKAQGIIVIPLKRLILNAVAPFDSCRVDLTSGTAKMNSLRILKPCTRANGINK